MNDNALGSAAGGPPGAPPGGVADGLVARQWFEWPGRVVRAALDDVVTTLYPTECETCGRPLLRFGMAPVCEECVCGVPPQSMTHCRLCSEALDMEGVRYAGQFPAEGLLCSPCRVVPPSFARAVAYAVYRDELRKMIHLLKYERMRTIAKPLGRLLARAIEMLEGEAGPELLVVAVPLFPSKQRQRGYNQAELLANAAVAELKRSRPAWKLLEAHEALRRVKDTRSQFELSPKGRRRNLQGAFAVADRAALAGREVLLVDDIYTTGATARQCASVLRRAGVSRVWVATVSRAQAEMVAAWDAEVRSGVELSVNLTRCKQ